MRVTHKSVYIPYQRNLEQVQYRKFQEEVRLSTGEDILSLHDAPDRLVDSKKLTSTIDQNTTYVSVLDSTLDELNISEEHLTNMSDKISQIRELTINATQTGNSGDIYSIGTYIKGLLEDIVRDANQDFNGKYLFSGTKTTSASLDQAPPASNDLPFEIVATAPSPTNRSGIEVIFKGNNEDRIINKDRKSTEIINAKADEIFGSGGTELFQSIIGIYNLVSFNNDGSKRQPGDYITAEELTRINDYQRIMADAGRSIDNQNAVIGGKMNRLQNVRNQMVEENTRLKEFRSMKSDTDITRSAINLKNEETALAYSLQVGARINATSLFDFLR